MKSICVYCGCSDKIGQAYLKAAYQMGGAIAERGLQLWYGAGCTGLMGALANGALESEGEVIGVIPKIFNTPRLAHTGLTRLEVVEDMHERKQRLEEQAEAFIAMPGGYGTFEELFEILTWAQIGLHSKPIGLLNTLGYFDPLITMVENARSQGFIYEEHRALFVHSVQPDDLLDALEKYQSPAHLDRWLTRED
jgi:uncharacterized protein (TIGR00730 family)